ncbi:MAG TPA: DUF4434 domain-containing protein [bacterium]|nr:DUF4434 domain-containing protein [bacterium]
MNGRRFPWLLVVLLMLFSLAGCGDDDDDNDDSEKSDDDSTDDDDDDTGDDDESDDDDTVEPPALPLDLVFIDPIYWLDKSAAEMQAEFDAMDELGVRGVLWRWTLRAGKATYPSDAYPMFITASVDDPLQTILTLARERGMDVYLGLNAERMVAEHYGDPVGPEYARCETLIDELAARYGGFDNLRGFYLPYEFTAAPDRRERDLVALIAVKIHQTKADWRAALTLRYPGVSQHMAAAKFFQDGLNIRFNLDDIDDDAARNEWAQSMIELCDAAGIDLGLAATRMGNHINNMIDALRDLHALQTAREAAGSPVTLYVQADLYDALGDNEGTHPAFGPAAPETIESQIAIPADGHAGFGWDYFRNDDGTLHGISAVPEPELYAKAVAVREQILNRTLRDGQLATVINGQYPLDFNHNTWQEDACWLTGLYLAAESYHYAVTGSDDAHAGVLAAWRAAARLADVTPKRGEVVRNYTRYVYEQTKPVEPGADTLKRWRRHPDKELYWVGDISVDQLSGYMNGLATFYDLAADEEERAEVRSLTEAIMGDILANGLRATEFTGEPTTYGNLAAAPELAANFLMIAYHITGDEKYRDAFDDITYSRYWDIQAILFHYVMHYLLRDYGEQHFQDSGLTHLFEYIDDEWAWRRWWWAEEFVYTGSYLFGNSYQNFTHQWHSPDAAGAARALGELYDFDPDLLENGLWFSKINRVFPEDTWIDMGERPGKEFMWTWSPVGLTEPRGGPTYRYTGVGFLLAYWQGRYFGWIR